MAKKKSPQRRSVKRSRSRSVGSGNGRAAASARFLKGSVDSLDGGLEDGASGLHGEATGRLIVTFLDPSPAGVRSCLATVKRSSGLSNICHARDFGVAEFDTRQSDSAEVTVLDEIGVGIINGDPQQLSAMSVAAQQSVGMEIEPERINEALDLPSLGQVGEEEGAEAGMVNVSREYLRGYQRAVGSLLASLVEPEAEGEMEIAAFQDTATATWGLQATRVLGSALSGRGVRVAVLDTGMDLKHPDFKGRSILGASFISGQGVQDGHGHGTHCIGTSCGPQRPGRGPRYGVAHEAEILAGKVLSNQGSGGDGNILAGINWAIRNQCRVVSMSLGRATRPGEPPMRAYEITARRGLAAGTLIIAAAGNDSRRPFGVRPVGSPANCPSIAAVAAVDSRLRIAAFSNGGINPQGGEVNVAGPGVDVLSSWPMPVRYRSIGGTSMATPHAAGIAALFAERSPGLPAVQLYRELARQCRHLTLPRRDVGHGLVQAV